MSKEFKEFKVSIETIGFKESTMSKELKESKN